MNKIINSNYSSIILRVGIAFVFIWFGYESFSNPSAFSRLVPAFTESLASAETLVKIHGVVEMILGLLLLIGIKVRIVSSILFLILCSTIILLPYGPNMIRDVGLAAALLSMAVKPKAPQLS